MLRLFVMRHAKSSWAMPGARDFDRELNDRGDADLVKVSAEIAAKKYLPSCILCSPAQRTRLTLDGIFAVLDPEVQIEFHDIMYSGSVENYADLVRSVQNPVPVMTIGHNPMTGSLANMLAGDGDPDLLSEISYRYPTATIAVLDFPIKSWSELQPKTGTLVDCIIPSTLRQP